MNFAETDEQKELRKAVKALAESYGRDYMRAEAKAGKHADALWREAGRLGFLGVNLPEEFGGGGAGIYELSLVLEELSAAGCPLLMMVVSPAICGTIIARYGTREQQEQWLPSIADGSKIMAFAITEPDAGSNSHQITTTGQADPEGGYILNGRKVFISGVDNADAIMVVGRTSSAEGYLRPALFIVPTDAPGLQWQPIEMELNATERQFMVFLDDVKLPADAIVGGEDANLAQLFAGLNPERIMVAALSIGIGRYALARATSYMKERTVWGTPIGAHQGLAHPLAAAAIEIELARLMMQKAAWLVDSGDDRAAGEAANMAKYAAAEASVKAVDQSVHSLGGNGLTVEYGLGSLINVARVSRIAPVSREMILNFVAQQTLGLPRSY
ncbi:acyl-CoA dehydrogenase family protein [Catelliglobosispora koreensis]|uniref:acyl-CoA dehydrogenase family protein n=1 Tax=Catelliglobosispora koreensis TaxID=129052 RepID=UPI00037FF3A3|nr:acyl-CoA dehydrogenase family protein [Catelliglobosispora koreensis]